MVDMHCHILWNEDDGPTSKEETMKLIEQAVKEGITTIISTSHSNHPLYDVEYNVVTNQVGILQNELINNNIPLTLYTGHEVRLSEKIIPLYQTNQAYRSNKLAPLKDIQFLTKDSQQAITFLVDFEIASGSNGFFKPTQTTTRAQAAKMFVNFLKAVKQ